MKRNVEIAVLNFVAVIAVFGLFDLILARFNPGAFVQAFTKPFNLAFMGTFALVDSLVAFFHFNNRMRAA